ncbi:MAG: hypothetical protein IJT69_04595 [Clostridia bacterium]|nr:hypothetical protein [Clostridia bacterium]
MSEAGILALLFISIAILIATITLTIIVLKRRKKLALDRRLLPSSIKPFTLFIIGFYLAAFCILLPHWLGRDPEMRGSFTDIYSAIVLTFHMVFRLSALNEEFANVIASTINNSFLNALYYCYSATIFLTAPLLAMGVILSFFKGVRATYKYYIQNCGKNIVVFSELNERSLALAQNIFEEEARASDKKLKRSVFVFTGVSKDADQALVERAENIGAVCTKKDVTTFGLKPWEKSIIRKIYLIADDEDTNLRKGLEIINICKNYPKVFSADTKIFVFSTAMECSILLDNANVNDLYVRRVDINRNLAYRFLYENSIYDRFHETTIDQEGKSVTVKDINVAIVGFGTFGQEMLKALCWMGQMPGYVVHACVFDKKTDIRNKMKAKAPKFVEEFHGKSGPKYDVNYHGGTDVKNSDFFDLLQRENEKHPFTHVFIGLGDDKANVEAVVCIRAFLCKQEIIKTGEAKTSGHKAAIFAVVYDNERYATLQGNLKGLPNQKKHSKGNADQQTDYEIEFFGNLDTVYSPKYVDFADLEELGYGKHIQWSANTPENRSIYNRFEYHRQSSIASMIYESYRDGQEDVREPLCPNLTKDIQQENEHNRWWVYMATIGYDFGAADARDDVAKVHYDMITYDSLEEYEKYKDASTQSDE